MDHIKFNVNDVEYRVGSDVDSNTSLLHYIRKNLQLPGTKYMCLGGRCGACMVSVSKAPGEPIVAVNSCLVSVASCRDWNITTIEKVGNRHSDYHAIQKAIANKNATQCGYCTPGWVMTMYSLLKGKGNLTMREIEHSLGSNVCRCTGYRSILEALKSFGTDAPMRSIMDIEDLKVCGKGDSCCGNGKCDDTDWCVVAKNDVSESSVIHFMLKDGKDWYVAGEVNDIFEILETKGYNSYMLVNGNTARGLVAVDEFPQIMIDISKIQSLKGSVVDQNLLISSGVTIAEMMDTFNNLSSQQGFAYLKEFNNVLKNFANVSVRNCATLAGNLMLTHKSPSVVSDIVIIFETVGATVTIVNAAGVRTTLSLPDFLKTDMMGKVILNVALPPLSNEYKVVVYKVTGKAENVGAILCTGFMYQLDLNSKVLNCTISLGLAQTMRATNTENYLRNKILFDNDTLQGAVNMLSNELIVVDKPPATSALYRKRLAIGLFYKSLLSICPPNVLNSRYRSGATNLIQSRPLSQARQIYKTDKSLYPLNEEIPKVEALAQTAGEAPYTDDIQSLPREVFAALVLSTVPVGKIENIDASVALKIPGVIAFYTAKDIPGINSFTSGISPASLTNEEILCNGEVKYYNQPIGVIVAESQHLAEKAAKYVTVKYTNVTTPVIDILEAKGDAKRTSLFSEVAAKEKGSNIAQVIKGDITIRGQYHACMETLTCVTLPTEEGLQVYTGSQHIDAVQMMTSRALNIPQNKIDVICRRIGGSYGFKISRSTAIAVLCNLIVHKLHRPCRFVQTLKNNMRAMGKRLPCHASFEIAVDKDGVIQYNNYDLYEDNGYIVNEPLVAFTLDCFNNCYKSKTWNYKVYNSVTDTPSNTWCRSPGTLEAIAMAELMMEQVSYETSIDPIKLRLANLDTDVYGAVKEMYEKLNVDCQYAERRATVDKYNQENRWKKRGLRYAFMIWNPMALPIYLDINISVYSGDGSVCITHSGIEMGQGINTKAVQICAYILNIPVDKIQVKATDTINSPNSFVSGASITSSNVGIGVQRCCKELLKKLEPIRAEMDNPTWLDLINKAFSSGVDLQTHSFVNVNDNVEYHVYGVACAEVEFDVLTGENQILRVDLAADVGQSISPGVDLGQVEGAFMMGLGYWTCEKLVYNKSTGELLTDSLNQYLVPQVMDTPQDFRTYFRDNSYSTEALLGSKATGEPATCLGVVVPIALREAIVAARSESGIPSTDWFKIDGPYTIENIYLASATRLEDFKFY